MTVSGGHNMVGPWCEGKGVRVLAYLPTAHIYGFVFELVAQYWGARIGYARMRTLTDTSVRNCKGDLRIPAPILHIVTSPSTQVECSIPAVWEFIRKGIESKVADGSPVAHHHFWSALNMKHWML